MPFFRFRWRRTLPAASASMQEIFTAIYQGNTWSGTESRSGPGSSLERTARLRAQLPGLLREYRIRSLLDIPCGDFNWMQAVALDGIHYIGADIVVEIIDHLSKTYVNRHREFMLLDVVRSPLLRVDCILCRDCLFHLTYDEALRALRNMKKSGSKYLLVTTFTNHDHNDDIETGMWRTLNMQIAPFHFPPPLYIIVENPQREDYYDKSLALWRLTDLNV